MFSITKATRPQNTSANNNFTLGLSFSDLKFVGSEMPENGVDFSFNAPITTFIYDLDVLVVSMGIGWNIGEAESNLFNVAIDFRPSIPVFSRPRFQVAIPLHINTEYFRLRGNQGSVTDEFVQNTIGVASGLNMRAAFGQRVTFSVSAVRNVGAVTQGFGSDGGRVLGFDIPARLKWENVFKKVGITAGYRFRFSDYDIDGERFDYEWTQHVVQLGINF